MNPKAPVLIQAVLVLYKMTLNESPAYQSWLTFAAKNPVFSSGSSLLVCDNTPGETGPTPSEFIGEYYRQPENPGLALSYNLALSRAAERGASWLLLMDQDTKLTAEYIAEVLETVNRWQIANEIVAIAPKLVENGIVQSPHTDLTTRSPQPLPLTYFGLPDKKLHIYNSGALMRVSRLLEIGGFPTEFWLDFLDHATFHLLRENGGNVWIMHSVLSHELSTNAPARPRDETYLARHSNVLEAEFLFYKKFGTSHELKWYRRRLIRTGLRAALRHRLFRIGWRTLMVARRIRLELER